jgi:hypothetical protein
MHIKRQQQSMSRNSLDGTPNIDMMMMMSGVTAKMIGNVA